MIQHGFTETFIYFSIWCGAVIYSIYSFYFVGNAFDHENDPKNNYNDFSLGLFGRYQDVSDFEWRACFKMFSALFPWLIINIIGSSVLRLSTIGKALLPCWYAAITLIATNVVFSKAAAGAYGAMVLSFYLIAKFKLPLGVWGISAIWWYYSPFHMLAKGEEASYLVEVGSCWLLLKCIWYGLEVCKGTMETSWQLILSYAFYPPTFFFGPLLSFPNFTKSLKEDPPEWNLGRCWSILKSFARLWFWYTFTIIALHYIYVSAISIRPDMIKGMTNWELNGFGISMGHFFHLKYIVFYGIPSAWAVAEGYIAPPPPCCVSHISLYSDMWRKFDPGLHEFLVSCIYVPIQRSLQGPRLMIKCFASMCCFIFVFIWHGALEYVFFWALLNFVSVTIEALFKEFFQKPSCKQFLDENFSKANQRRLLCLCIAPLQYFSMLSNYFFIGNYHVGVGFFDEIINKPPIYILYMFFFMYGAAQTSLTLKLWQEEKKVKAVKKD